MARLTRTQKYASLRDELANDKETATTSQDLTGFEQRLNNVQQNLAPEQPYAQNAFEQEQVGQSNNFSGSSYFDSFVNTPKQDNSNRGNGYDSYFGVEKTVDINVDDIYKQVFNDVNDITDNTISRKERDTYLNQTISDVNVHNMMNGQQSLNQIIDNTVNEVRHTEAAPKPVTPVINEAEPVDNTYDWTAPVEEKPVMLDADEIVRQTANRTSDENFSNTVSMEITKIMDQMASAPQQPKAMASVPQEPKVNVQEEVKFVAPEPVSIQERPQDSVEIKNIDELKDEELRNTVSGTIPFVVSASDDEDIEEDEEEDGSNTVLNVILIVLIIVLIAVLGLIIFYILKTKGIF